MKDKRRRLWLSVIVGGESLARLAPKWGRRRGGLDETIISLHAGRMTVRDIGHYLARAVAGSP